MSDTEDRRVEPMSGDGAGVADGDDRPGASLGAPLTSAAGPSDRHVAVAVPIRAVEHNKRIASSVLAGGFAYRLFLWLLPFGLLVGGALGLSNADSAEDAIEGGGIPGAISNAVGDAARAADSESWWLFAIGIPLLIWAGFTGAKAIVLIHALVWDESPPKPKPLQASLAFTGMVIAFMAAVGFTWSLRGGWPGLLAPLITVAPLAALWVLASLHLPHRDATWRELVPGALLVAVGFQALHQVVTYVLVPKLEKSTSLYGSLGATTTFLFFMYITATLVVLSAVLNSSLYEELTLRRDDTGDELSAQTTPAA